jgi:threonine/homoserine/homoserine lactone efflux protein
VLIGFIAGFLGSSLGWQINLLAIQRGISRGRTAALLVGCGAVTADLIFLWGGFTGAKPLLAHPETWGVIRIAGIAILLILAARAYFIHGKPRPSAEKVISRNPTRNFLVGFLVVLGNPAVFFLWLGVVSFVVGHFPEAHHPNFKWYFIIGFVIGSLAWFGPLAFLLLKKIKEWDETHLQFLSRLSAAVLVLVAILLIFEKI